MGYTDFGKRRAVFWTSASESIGGGHLARCQVLFRHLVARGWECYIAVNPEGMKFAATFDLPIRSTMVVEPGIELPQQLKQAVDGCDVVVIDNYDSEEAIETSLRGWARTLVIVDDHAEKSHDCDLLIDQTPERDPHAYDHLLPDECRVLTGSSFALLRNGFAARREEAIRRRVQRSEVAAVFVAFGTMDSRNLIQRTLRALQAAGNERPLHVALSRHAAFRAQVEEQASRCDFDVYIGDDPNWVADSMVKSDLAVGAMGVNALERCCLGLPSIAVRTASNQSDVTSALERLGAVRVLGDASDVSESDIQASFLDLVGSVTTRHAMSRRAALVCDGRGGERVSTVLEEMSTTASSHG